MVQQDPQAGEDMTAATQAKLEFLRNHVNSLEPAWRDVVQLRYFEGLTVDEIAQNLETTPNAIRMKLKRSIEQLRKLTRSHSNDE
jgi:RNA polymerase sigma-70 factor (ECF subfamily)